MASRSTGRAGNPAPNDYTALSTLTRAVHMSLFMLGLAAAGTLAPEAYAQDTSTQVTRIFQVPAGPLASALAGFAVDAGASVSASPELVRGINSPGVHGSFPVADGLTRLLVDTGLEAVPGGDKAWVLRRKPAVATPMAANADTTLGEVKVTAQAERSAITEGTGSYTSNGPTTLSTPLNLSLKETPQTISVMTSQRLEDQALASIGDALQQTPGIALQNIGGDRYSVMSRGYAIDSYQLDGVPTTLDITTQDVSQSLADLVVYDRVEVLRGASGLMTGAGDPSGTINMVRKRPTNQFQGYVSAGVGSWDKHRVEADVSGPINASGTVRGRVVAAYQKADSYIDYYKQQKSVLYGFVEADVTDSTLVSLGIDYQENDPRGGIGNGVGLPLFTSTGAQTNFDRSTSFVSRDNRNETKAINTFVAVKQKLGGDWGLDIAANHLHQKRSFSWVGGQTWNALFNQQTGALPLNSQSGDSQQNQTGLNIKVHGPFQWLGREHKFSAGFNYGDYENVTDYGPKTAVGVPGNIFNLGTWSHVGITADTPHNRTSRTDMKESGFYAAARFKPADDLSLILGSRVSRYAFDYDLVYSNGSYSYQEHSSKRGAITPYAGVVYDLDRTHAIYASYTTIFKPQTYQDRTGAFLQPREGTNYEVGLKSEFLNGKVNSAVAVYQIRQDNLAVSDPGYTIPGTTNSAYRAETGAKTQGVDMEMNGEVATGWNIAASYTYGKTENAAGQQITTTFPKHMVKLWTTYRLPGQWNGLTLGGGVNWQSRAYFSSKPWWSSMTLNAQQEAYALASLMARYDFNTQVSVTLNINNLFDKKYLGSMDTTFYTGVYGAPRNATFTLRAAF